jgi:hypothetical protein
VGNKRKGQKKLDSTPKPQLGLTFVKLRFIQLDAIGSKIGKWDGAFMSVRSFHPLLMEDVETKKMAKSHWLF